MPVTPSLIGYKPAPYMGGIYVGIPPIPPQAIAAAAPALTEAAKPIIAGALDGIKSELPKILAAIKQQIAGITSPCAQAIQGFAREWDATAGTLLNDAKAATDPVVKYALAKAVVELGETAPWPTRWAGQAVVDPPGPFLKPRKCSWATAQSTKLKYTAPAAAIMQAPQAAAEAQINAGNMPDVKQVLSEQTTLKATFPAWVWAAGGLGLLLLLRR